jgi:hypothetical protein
MDPMLVQGLRQMKEFLQQGIFTQKEFDDQKTKLMQLYPLVWSGPLSDVPGVTTVTHSPVSQPLKGISDKESREPSGKHRFGITNAVSFLSKNVSGHFHNFPRQCM